jgi:starch phosphorylase
VRRVKHNLASLGWQVSASRMVKDYVEQLYEPTAGRADELVAGDHGRAKELAAWKARVAEAWRAVHVDSVESETSTTELGEPRQVTAQVSIGQLGPDEVAVQLVHGPVGQNDEITAPEIVPMEVAGDAADGHLRFRGSFTCERPGRYGFAVRVVPNHPDLVTPVELGLVASA